MKKDVPNAYRNVFFILEKLIHILDHLMEHAVKDLQILIGNAFLDDV